MAKLTLEELEALSNTRSLTTSEHNRRFYLRHHEVQKARVRENARRNQASFVAKRSEKRRIAREQKAADYATWLASPEGQAAEVARLEDRAKKKRAATTSWRKANLEKNREKVKLWQERNPEKIKAARKKRREKIPAEVRAKEIANWRAANTDHVKAYQQAYDVRVREEKCAKRRAAYAADPETHCAAAKAARLKNPEGRKAARRRRRARVKGALGSHTVAEIEALFLAQEARCANPYCCTAITKAWRHLDHTQAITKGGSENIANLQWLCPPCNQRKSDLSVKTWLEREAKRFASLKKCGMKESQAS